jgi:hypothetical protein
MINRFRVLALLSVTLGLVGARYTADVVENVTHDPDVSLLTGAGTGTATALRWSPQFAFRLVPAQALGRLAALDSAELVTLLKLNRVDEGHLRRRTLIVPDAFADELDYAPFPPTLAALDSVPKFILVSQRIQAFGAYEFGRLVRWGPTSTGKRTTPTASGLFFTNWKSKETTSTEDSTWILKWYVNFVSDRGMAFHQYALPGRPASHGCVRLLEADAYWLFNWSDQWEVARRAQSPRLYGTPVLSLGEYDYARPAPWLALAEDPFAARVSLEELEEALAPLLPTIEDRTRLRIAATPTPTPPLIHRGES